MKTGLHGRNSRLAIERPLAGLPGRAVGPSRLPPPWYESRYVTAAVVLDFAITVLVAVGWLNIRFANHPKSVEGVSYSVLAALLVPVWAVALALAGAYEGKFLGAGSEEFRRIVNAGVRLLAIEAIASFAIRAELARSFVGIALPLVTLLTVLGRFGLRHWLHQQRSRGRCMRRVLVVGSSPEVIELIRHVRRAPQAGLQVVAACVTGHAKFLQVGRAEVPVVAEPEDVLDVLPAVRAHTVAVVGSSESRGYLRGLAMRLEGSGVDVVVAPAITDVAGPRIVVRPVEGLPLLHIEEPELSGGRRLLKACLDRLAAAILLLILFPIGVMIALAIRFTSPGPVLFRQPRIGKEGEPFVMLKFRTMRVGAEAELATLKHRNEHDGPLFKLRDDPRLTPVGRWLRRYSLDELPQLWNVLTGSMSLVGPRPPLPDEVEYYAQEVHRRFLVRPGMTGLWQVQGRADLPWEESVRLDLYYVENWSLAMDLVVLWKTVFAVVNQRGAY